MSTKTEERLATLENRTATLEAWVARVERERWLAPVQPRRTAPAPSALAAHEAGQAPERGPAPAPAPAPELPAEERVSLEDLVGGRLLAWVGGVALLVGVAFFLAVAVSHGWLGEGSRCLLAAAGAGGLLSVAVRLRERGGRQEAVLTAAGAALGVLFLDVAVASQAYDLIGPFLATALALLVGAAGVALAVRWEAKPVGALGVLGGLVAPVLAGAPTSGGTMALLLAAAAAAGAVLVQQRWDWLGLAAFAVTAPQVLAWLDLGQEPWSIVLTLSLLGVVTTCQAIGFEVRRAVADVRLSAAFLLAANALLLAAGGHWALHASGHAVLSDAWLVGLAAAHGLVGFGAIRSPRVSADLRLLALTIGVVLADIALGQLTSGIALPIAFSISALGFAVVGRAVRAGSRDALATHAGLGAHLLLAAGHALVIDAPPGAITDTASASMALAAVAAASFAAGRMASVPREARAAADTLALALLAYLAASTLAPLTLVLAWSAESIALGKIWRRTEDEVAGLGALAHLGGAATVAMVFLTPPLPVLSGGFDHVVAAATALGAVAVTCALLARSAGGEEAVVRGLLAAGAATVLLLGSGLVVTAAGGGQTGQMWLSALWAASGAAALIAGLVGRSADLRWGALSLLGLTIGKVFILDLAGLDSAYRAVSFVALGVVLLGAAFAWQRLRPLPRTGTSEALGDTARAGG